MNRQGLQRLVAIALYVATQAGRCGAGAPPEDAPLRHQEQRRGYALYGRPGPLDWIKKAPGDIGTYGKGTFRKRNALMIGMVVASTALLIVCDQYLIDKSKNLGDHLGITHTNYQKSFASIHVPGTKNSLELEGPFDSGSALYFIGDGWVDVGIAGSFLGVGLAKSDNRALQTSSEIAQSILASGTVVQLLKHVTGRESPFTTEVPRGVWRFFPNQYRYSQHVPEFDAFPSGHLAAAMATFTVITSNYPEYTFVVPVGYTLMGLLSFQMMNNGVHWASDYPLAFALGYGFGKIAVREGRRTGSDASFRLYPVAMNRGAGVRAVARFGAERSAKPDS